MENTRITKTPVKLFLDLSKAFDTLNFDILLHTLQYYGVNGVPLLLIKCYLIEIYQYTKYDNLILRFWRLKLLFLRDLF